MSNKFIENMTIRDIQLLAVAALAFTLAFGLTNSYYTQISHAQSESVLVTSNGTEVIPAATVDSVANSLYATVAGIVTLASTAIGIVTYVVGAIRSRTGDKIISNQTTEWLQDLFEKVKTLDNSVRDEKKDIMELINKYSVFVDVAKRANPDIEKAINDSLALIEKKNKEEVLPAIQHWQHEADTVKFKISPKDDPVTTKI